MEALTHLVYSNSLDSLSCICSNQETSTETAPIVVALTRLPVSTREYFFGSYHIATGRICKRQVLDWTELVMSELIDSKEQDTTTRCGRDERGTVSPLGGSVPSSDTLRYDSMVMVWLTAPPPFIESHVNRSSPRIFQEFNHHQGRLKLLALCCLYCARFLVMSDYWQTDR